MTITETALLDAVREALSVSDDTNAVTVNELCDALSITHKTAWQALKLLVAEDVVECVKVRRQNIAGHPQKLPGYRVKSSRNT
jgi:predicted ArsR family transcriptional regulator